VIAEGAPEAVQSDPQVLEAYLGASENGEADAP
jgi:ABC-type branched-subunit amino acid transport system ATPase component